MNARQAKKKMTNGLKALKSYVACSKCPKEKCSDKHSNKAEHCKQNKKIVKEVFYLNESYNYTTTG